MDNWQEYVMIIDLFVPGIDSLKYDYALNVVIWIDQLSRNK